MNIEIVKYQKIRQNTSMNIYESILKPESSNSIDEFILKLESEKKNLKNCQNLGMILTLNSEKLLTQPYKKMHDATQSFLNCFKAYNGLRILLPANIAGIENKILSQKNYSKAKVKTIPGWMMPELEQAAIMKSKYALVYGEETWPRMEQAYSYHLNVAPVKIFAETPLYEIFLKTWLWKARAPRGAKFEEWQEKRGRYPKAYGKRIY